MLKRTGMLDQQDSFAEGNEKCAEHADEKAMLSPLKIVSSTYARRGAVSAREEA
jgi:hypothetical protein